MSDTAESKEFLKRYIKARIPLIVLNSMERARVFRILQSVSRELALPFCVHTPSKGTYDLNSEHMLDSDHSVFGAIGYISEQMQHRQNLTIILTVVPDLSSDNDDAQSFLDLVTLANETGGVIIILSTKPIWNQLQKLGMSIIIDTPNEMELYSIIKEYMDEYRSSVTVEWNDSDIREAAAAMTGLTMVEAENVIASLIAKGNIMRTDLDEVRRIKDRTFSDISGLEKISVDEKAPTLGGLVGLKTWLDEKRALFSPEKRDILLAKGLRPPRGMLLVGVPGCGKSLSAKAIAASWRLPLYRLDFATVQGIYVGQSEQQLKEALAMAETVSPCILWVDEIEKGLGGSDISGVTTHMVGQFLFWLQECRKQVFVVATANDVTMLPPELLRAGRFDALFFVDLPTAEERWEILALYMRKYFSLEFSGALAEQIIGMTDGFSGADLESTVRALLYREICDESFMLTAENLLSAFQNVVPLSKTSPEKIKAIRDWGRHRALPASGRPIG